MSNIFNKQVCIEVCFFMKELLSSLTTSLNISIAFNIIKLRPLTGNFQF